MFYTSRSTHFIKKYQIPCVFLAIAAVFYTWASLRVGFLADDLQYLYEIQKTTNPFDYILHPFTTVFAWRPITDLSWVLNEIASGTNPIGYHIVNLAIFFATLVVLFYTLRHIVSEHTAIWATTIFALMPIHNESIVWLSGRTDSLALLFFLLSLHSYILFRKASQGHSGKYLAASTLFFAASILSKESAILGPAIYLLIDGIILQKRPHLKSTIITMLPYAICIGGLLILRVVILGNVVSHNTTVTDQYSLIPTFNTIVDTLRAFTFTFNISTASAAIPHFASIWKYLLLPLGAGYLLLVTLVQKPWKNSSLRKAVIIGVVAIICLVLPVLSLMEHITPDLQHIRFLYAPSVVVAAIFAYIFTTYSSTAVRYTQHIGLGIMLALYIVANYWNMQPWIAATAQSQHLLETFSANYPEFANASAPTTVYVLHTPSEYRGAFLFHDYYSLQQAIKQYTANANLLAQSVGTKPIFPAAFCNDTTPQNVHVLSWNGTGFDDQDALIAPWNTHATPRTALTFNTQAAWENAHIKIRNANYHFSGDTLILDNLGDDPQIQISLPEGSYSRDWHTAALHADAKNPALFSWNSPKTVTPTFNSLLPETVADSTSIPLCAYPNWIVAGALRDIEITFTPGTETQIAITSLEMY